MGWKPTGEKKLREECQAVREWFAKYLKVCNGKSAIGMFKILFEVKEIDEKKHKEMSWSAEGEIITRIFSHALTLGSFLQRVRAAGHCRRHREHKNKTECDDARKKGVMQGGTTKLDDIPCKWIHYRLSVEQEKFLVHLEELAGD